MKYTELEFWYDNDTLFIGAVRLCPESNNFEYQSFNVVQYIRGIDHDITSAFAEKWINNFKESFELHVRNKHLDDLRDNENWEDIA